MNARLIPLALLGFVITTGLSKAATLSGVRSITFSNTRADWYYIEELEVLNTGATDVASAGFGTTVLASGAPAFGSTILGGIDDVVGAGCCANGWHSDTNVNPPAQFYTITFPSAQDITDITFWNRQDGCCQERMDGIAVTYFDGVDGTGNLLGSQQISDLGATGAAGSSVAVIPEPSTAIFAALSLAILAGHRRRRR